MEPKDTKEAAGLVIGDYNPQACADAGARLTLRGPDGKVTKAWLELMGADSDAYQEKSRELQRRRSREMERAKKIKFATPEELEEDSIELLVVATKGWGGLEVTRGQALPFTPAAARDLYQRRPDIREQADAFINERANFLPKAATP
jgi:hypothetical protein